MSRKKRIRYPEGLHKANIEKFSHDGRGIATCDGKTTFIDNALPLEEVEFKYTQAHNRYNEGFATTILQSSSQRVTPHCPHFTVCGGCVLQHLNTSAQRDLKENTLKEHFLHFGKLTIPNLLPPLVANEWGYRRKARLGVRYVHKKDKVLVGFREKRSSFIAEIHTCKVLHQSAAVLIDPLQVLIQELDSFQSIPQIEVAVSSNTVALVFRHLQPLSDNDTDKLIEFAKKHNIYLYLQPKGLDSVHLLYPKDTSPLLSYEFPDYNINQYFMPTDFTQVNFEMNALMIKRAIELLELQKSDAVLDLYCGIGNFTLPIARFCEQIVGVEGNQQAIARAQYNALHNGISNAEFYCFDLVKDFSQESWAQRHYDKILLDPARSGAKECLERIDLFNAKKIIYISCNPATLARDAGILGQKQYKLVSGGIMDMFPHTNHVESIAIFEK